MDKMKMFFVVLAGLVLATTAQAHTGEHVLAWQDWIWHALAYPYHHLFGNLLGLIPLGFLIVGAVYLVYRGSKHADVE